MKHPSQPRTTADLRQSIIRQLNMYGLAASAAGVGILALAPASQAKIVYTPTHQVIGPGGSYQLDLNHDGITDFTILESETSAAGKHSNCLCVAPAPGRANGVWGFLSVYGVEYALALKQGTAISGAGRFRRQGHKGIGMIRTINSRTQPIGDWINVTDRYLGLQFHIHGTYHYGWARLSARVTGSYKNQAVLTGYAYETIPNKSIVAGQTKGPDDSSIAPTASLDVPAREPATLSMLALGAPALAIWRREPLAGAARQSG
jgi:hypothetical protein